MKEGNYSTWLLFTLTSPSMVEGGFPKIGRTKLLLKLKSLGEVWKRDLSEKAIEEYKTESGGYWIPMGYGTYLEINPLKN